MFRSKQLEFSISISYSVQITLFVSFCSKFQLIPLHFTLYGDFCWYVNKSFFLLLHSHMRFSYNNFCSYLLCSYMTWFFSSLLLFFLSTYIWHIIYLYFVMIMFLFFLREFQPMTSTPRDSSLSSDQDTNQFLVGGIEPQISYSTIRDFTSWAN